MEFPDTGQRCTISDCKLLDFLPFTCSHCNDVFCKDHFHVISHKCSKFVDNIADGTERLTHFVCTQNECKEKSAVEMPCVKCNKHFCVSHRHHGCLELSAEEKLNELKKWEKPKQEFSNAKTVVDKEIAKSLKKSKNPAMAHKVFSCQISKSNEFLCTSSNDHQLNKIIPGATDETQRQVLWE